MLMKKNAIVLLVAALLLAGFPGSASATPAPTIVGSWEAISVLGPGMEAPGLFTFNRDGTWIASANEVAFSNAHGAWKRSGPRNFSGTNKGFIFGAGGSVSLLVTNTVELEVSLDGQSFTAVFATVISTPGGTVVNSFTGTATGTRINP